MNSSILITFLGRLLQFIALSLAVPALVGWIYEEPAWSSYLQTAFVAGVMGIAIQIVVSWRNEPTGQLTRREGFIAVGGDPRNIDDGEEILFEHVGIKARRQGSEYTFTKVE